MQKKTRFFAHEINFVSKLHITKNQCINLTEKNLAVTLIFITFAVTKRKKYDHF